MGGREQGEGVRKHGRVGVEGWSRKGTSEEGT